MAIGNFLQWGATHLYEQTALLVDSDLRIGYVGQQKISIRGALVSSSPLLDANKVKITQERFIFLIDTVLLAATGLTIQRGLEIIYENNAYEVVLDPKGSKYYNDPTQQRTVINCTWKEKCC